MIQKIVTQTNVVWEFGQAFNIFTGVGIKTRVLEALIDAYNTNENGFVFQPEHGEVVPVIYHKLVTQALDDLAGIQPLDAYNQCTVRASGFLILGVVYRLMEDDDDDRIRDILDCLALVDPDISKGKLSTYLSPVSHYNNYVSDEFLYIMFYATMLVSNETPTILAVEDFDAKLNIKVCTQLTIMLILLCKKYHKQMFVTANNPATLDAIDLNDIEQSLFVISQNDHKVSSMCITAVNKPKSSTNEPLKLSEAYLRGYLGGLPKYF